MLQYLLSDVFFEAPLKLDWRCLVSPLLIVVVCIVLFYGPVIWRRCIVDGTRLGLPGCCLKQSTCPISTTTSAVLAPSVQINTDLPTYRRWDVGLFAWEATTSPHIPRVRSELISPAVKTCLPPPDLCVFTALGRATRRST